MIVRKGKILNEDGEWEDYIEEEDPDKPPIAYTYMGSAGLEIEEDDEVVDFCMQYRIPKIEGLEKVKHLKVSTPYNSIVCAFFILIISCRNLV